MRGQIVLPDSSGVNLDDTVQRRQWMEKAFRALGLWDNLNGSLKWEGHEEAIEEKLCVLLDSKVWHNVSRPHFEWAYDEGLWRSAVKRGNLTLAQVPWPWEGHPYPAVGDLTLGVSPAYKGWRDRHGKSTEELPERASRAHRFDAPDTTSAQGSEYQQSTEQLASSTQRMEKEIQNLQDKVASQGDVVKEMSETLRENATAIEVMREERQQHEAGTARILGQVRIELNALRDQLARGSLGVSDN